MSYIAFTLINPYFLIWQLGFFFPAEAFLHWLHIAVFEYEIPLNHLTLC